MAFEIVTKVDVNLLIIVQSLAERIWNIEY